ncbi:hypothetical protein [Clostridium luticellarii]|uniref:Uncharacterized protein n=1 Tax=Clostridium luticellarii TaxID=1691940 RepID=A0A2T0BNB1_9CLOT|nr:hypothetical protein [Clostridium luticellarii]MCI1945445.1 hypothetical protein [Clostridium luticellarii]MCI1968778.1 hypothetical protein [Clostridium luticellarii]MCI1994948.1 hypothetical protein [Clostridium luticellarii]MCI2040205.1 hypothetical protein [Clostridium luticellarii]PRR85369.1 hypothetical protein CLLU_16510 [Clostridium luticellarii]
MVFLKWLCSLMLVFFLTALMLKAGGLFINILLLICTFVFMLDTLVIRKKHI